jgi:nitroreductase/NAD-dependent dihydropyrimidine dehydrogenase PreA subunit
MAQITVDRTACVKCGGCVDVCVGARVFRMTDEGSEAQHPERCWACGQCVCVCPVDAIDHATFPLEATPIIDPDEMPATESLISAFRYRRSVRTYQAKPVPREIVRELVSIGRWAPTATNNQALDWIAFDERARILELARATVDGLSRYVRLARNPLAAPFVGLVAGRENVKRLRGYSAYIERMNKHLDTGQDPVFYHAPIVLVGHTQKANIFGRDDAVYAMYNMMLAAERYDLGTCQIGFFQGVVSRSARLRRSIGIPEGRAPQVCLAVGYPSRKYRRAPERRTPDLAWNPKIG